LVRERFHLSATFQPRLLVGCLASRFELYDKRTDFVVALAGDAGRVERFDLVIRGARRPQSDQYRFDEEPCLDVRVM
jgi:hypothetical protein